MDLLEPIDVDTMTKTEAEEVIASMLYPWEQNVPFTFGYFTFRWHFYEAMADLAGRRVRR